MEFIFIINKISEKIIIVIIGVVSVISFYVEGRLRFFDVVDEWCDWIDN